MLNYDVLSDFDFEILCRDILSKKLGIDLVYFAKGPDQGVDLADSVINPSIIVQVKHYSNSTFSQLRNSLKKEIVKLEKLKPNIYYIITSQSLTRKNIEEIYVEFKDYMPSTDCIITKESLDTFLLDKGNDAILRKHFKLWVTADLVLSDMLNRDVFIDCEYLMEDIEEELPYFVETQVFFQALDILRSHKKILLYGDPGVGKTLTSKMLLLNFIKHGYSVRYTTNGSIANLKQALSSDKDKKEIVFLDDFLGQHYLNLQYEKESEILALVRYIDRNPNKMLILNSRVTILNQAIQSFANLEKYLIFKDFQMYKIDLGEISDIEKAKIFLLKLQQNKVTNDYYNNIRKNYRYRTIINHKNYNPRLIEFVCTQKRYSDIPTNEYYDFIYRNLENPNEVWRNEFDNRLGALDRLLMYVLYSITDSSVEVDVLKVAFDFLIKDTVEETIDNFYPILARLNESLLKTELHLGKQRVKVLNPSINDFLRASLMSNANLRNKVLSYAVYYEQLERLMEKNEFEEKLKNLVFEENIEEYYISFTNKKHLDLYVHLIAKYRVESNDNLHLVFEILFNGLRDVNIGKIYFSALRTIVVFMADDLLWNYYDLKNYNFDEDTIENIFLECTNIEDAVKVTNLLLKRLDKNRVDYNDLYKRINKEINYIIEHFIENYEFNELISGYDLDDLPDFYLELYNQFKKEINNELLRIEDSDIRKSIIIETYLSYNNFSYILDEIVDDLIKNKEKQTGSAKYPDYSIDEILNRTI